jgi:hypothetical protein
VRCFRHCFHCCWRHRLKPSLLRGDGNRNCRAERRKGRGKRGEGDSRTRRRVSWGAQVCKNISSLDRMIIYIPTPFG